MPDFRLLRPGRLTVSCALDSPGCSFTPTYRAQLPHCGGCTCIDISAPGGLVTRAEEFPPRTTLSMELCAARGDPPC